MEVLGRRPDAEAVLLAAQAQSDYAELRRRVQAAGLLHKRPGRYAARSALTLGALFAGLAVIAATDWLPVRLAAVVFLAGVFGQVGFLGHDAVHQQISGRGPRNGTLGLMFYSLLLGVSVSWWRDDHTRHHAFANQAGRDPNLEIAGLAFTGEQARAKRGLSRLVMRRQAWLLFGLFLLEGFAGRVLSVRYLLRVRPVGAAREAALMGLHAGVYMTLFLWQDVAEGLVLALLHQMLAGLYLASVFAPNHKGMPVLAAGTTLDLLRRQTLTARNVRPGWLTDLAYGGLNYQIEHHLFPTMPRPHLAAARRIVRAFCEERRVRYHETGVLDSYREILRHLRTISATA
jgi:fatty acid desaturase